MYMYNQQTNDCNVSFDRITSGYDCIDSKLFFRLLELMCDPYGCCCKCCGGGAIGCICCCNCCKFDTFDDGYFSMLLLSKFLLL